MSSIKLGDIIKRVQRQFGDDVESQITEEDIVRYVNDACLEIVTNNETSEGYQGTLPVVSGQRAYNLPPDLIKLRSVRVNGLKLRGETYEQLSEQDAALETTVGTPIAYWVYANKLNLYPIPDDSTALGTIQILYVKTPDILTVDMKDRQPDVPIQYHPRIVEYCIAQAAEMDDDTALHQFKMSQFSQGLSGLRQNAEQPDSAGVYASITYVEEYS